MNQPYFLYVLEKQGTLLQHKFTGNNQSNLTLKSEVYHRHYFSFQYILSVCAENVSTSHLCRLHIEARLASKVVVILHTSVKQRFKVSTDKLLPFSQINVKTAFWCQTVHIHPSAQLSSNVQVKQQ